MAGAALNSFAVACLLALVVVAGAARTDPADPGMHATRPCHSNNGWSNHLCKDVCKASGFVAYDFRLPIATTGDEARCCCCPQNDMDACLEA
ncbi:hypothetical protein EJB05_20745, partial [Eragrostis curvula]